jgi:nitrite reductase/ring-hydroxylating ferredoxin subunit
VSAGRTEAAAEPLLLCRIGEIPEGGGRGFSIGEGAEAEHIFLLHIGGRIFGYLNSCPHIGTPLDLIPGEFLTWDKRHILCRTHGARFRIHDGYCISGPCRDDKLRPLPLKLVGDQVLLEAWR